MDNNLCHAVTDRYYCPVLCRTRRLAICVVIGLVVLLSLAVESHGDQYKMISYGEGTAHEPRYRTMENELGWSSESSALPVGADVRWVDLESCPRREEVILGVIDANYNLTVQTWNGSGWTSYLPLVHNTGSGDAKFFDISYESKSGDAIVVYGTDQGRSPRYRTWNGVKWSRERTVDLPGDRSRPQYWVLLESDPESDEIVLVCQDDFRRLYCSVWDGNDWTSSMGEFDKSKTDNYLGFGVCREGLSGDVLVMWRPEEQPHLQYMVWNGTTWGPIQATEHLPLGTDVGMIEVSGDPQSDRMIVAVGDIHGDLAVTTWSGSAWSSFVRIADNCRVIGENRSWDILFEGSGGRGLLVYSDGSSPVLRYRTYDCASDPNWSEENVGPTLAGPINVLQLEGDGCTSEAMLLSLGDGLNLQCILWDGTRFSQPRQLETNAAANCYEPLGSVWVIDNGPDVALLSPNGGERIEGGTTHLITWRASQDLNGTHVDIFYTTSGSAGNIQWKPITVGEINRFQHPWMVPFEESEQCLVKVTVYDQSMNSSFDVSDSLFAIYTNTGCDESRGVESIPEDLVLLKNQPNPFAKSTLVNFLSPVMTLVDLSIYDSCGRQVKSYSLVARVGHNSVKWDGKDGLGRSLPPGVYFARLSARGISALRTSTQMILIE